VYGLLAVSTALASASCQQGDARVACEPGRELPGHTPLPAEVDAAFAAHCRECHDDPPTMFAPMPLRSWQDVQAQAPARHDGASVYERIFVRIHDPSFPMPPKTRAALDDETRAMLDAWIEQCAPAAED
jgi:uncharacterized membrane protein